jgi:hypothetical protein
VPYLYTASVYINTMQSDPLNAYPAQVDTNVRATIDHGTRMLAEGADARLHLDVASAYGWFSDRAAAAPR